MLNTQEEVDKYAEDNGFVKSSTNHTDAGKMIYYRCKSIPKAQAKKCVSMKVLKPNLNTKFVVTRSVGEHTHSTVVCKRQRKCSELWEYIYNLKFEDGLKPRSIKQHLKRNRPNDAALTVRQIRHILKSMEAIKIPSTFSFGELIEWLKPQTKVPERVDDAFVVDWIFNKNDKSFAFVVSTSRLLRNAAEQTNLSADGTYKITWQGFPLIVVGTIDREKHFHVTAIVVTSNERESEYEFVFRTIKMGIERESKHVFQPHIILSDYAGAIRNGFFAVFGPSDHAVLLFLDKWQEVEEELCTYFKSTWLGETTRNWFTGYSPFIPAHNNGVVRFVFSYSNTFNLNALIIFNNNIQCVFRKVSITV